MDHSDKISDMASATGGKVGNMRALFEAKQENSSPPSRGRSPAGSDIHSIRSISSRPTSKIRSSFVVVEKAGTLGPMLGLRRISDVQDNAIVDTEAKESVVKSVGNVGKDSIIEEEGPVKAATDTPNITKNIKEVSKGEAILDKEKDSSITAPASSQLGKKTTRHIPSTIKTTAKAESSKVNGSGSPLTKKQPTTPKQLAGKDKADVRRPAAIRSAIAPKSPQSTSSMKAQSPVTSSRKPGIVPNSRLKQESAPKPASRVSTPRTSLASNVAKENKTVKPRPKSPTKPARLPAAAMASTASSAAKTSTADKPSTHSSEKPRVSTGNDFLARMMRPTAASASKVHEKFTSNTLPPKSLPKSKRTSAVSGKRMSDVSAETTSKTATPDLEPAQDEQEIEDANITLPDPVGTEDIEQAAVSDEPVDIEASKETVESDRNPSLVTSEVNDHVDDNTETDSTAHVASLDHPTEHDHPVPLQANDDGPELTGNDSGTIDATAKAAPKTNETILISDSSDVKEEIVSSQASLVALEEPHKEKDISTGSVHSVEVADEPLRPIEGSTNGPTSTVPKGSVSKAERFDSDDKKDDSAPLQAKEESSPIELLSRPNA